VATANRLRATTSLGPVDGKVLRTSEKKSPEVVNPEAPRPSFHEGS